MHLTLHRSNQIEALGRAFLDRLRGEPLGDPFRAETVLVGSTGLRDWLRRQVAEELGIAAQLSFVYPGTLASWLHQAHRLTRSGVQRAGEVGQGVQRATESEEETPWVPDRLVWVVASELLAWRDGPGEGSGDRLSSYLRQIRTQGDGPGTLSAPLFALATEISRLFLRYHAWRPGMIARWAGAREGEGDRYTRRDGLLVPFDERSADLAWQPALWRRVRDRLSDGGASDPLAELGAMTGSGALHVDHLAAESLHPDETLRAALRSVLPDRLSLFGVGGLSPLQLLALGRIAQAIPVHWFFTAPTPFWLGDQTLAGVTAQNARRRAFLDGADAGEQRLIYLDRPKAWAERADGDGLAEVEGVGPAEDVLESRSFDDLEGVVCPLVAAFGRVPRASQLLVEQIMPNALEGDTVFVHPLVQAAQGKASASPVDCPTVLHRLQADVYMLESAAYDAGGTAGTPFRHDIEDGDPLVSQRGARAIDPEDRSLGFHACYGPSRQVDAVRDLIVEALANDRSLRPADIAVMTPDIAAYAPLIEATFLPHAPRSKSLERTGIPGIPIRIQDRAIRSTNPVAGVLLALLALAEGRRTVSEVIGLLGLQPVHDHFGMEREEVSRVEAWLRAAGARWGADASDVRQAAGKAASDERVDGPADSRLRHTLLAALERLALGAVMPLEAAATRLGAVERSSGLPVYPLDEAGDRALAAKAVLFLETVIGTLEELRSPRSLEDWLNVFANESEQRPGLLQRFVTLPASRAWQKAQVIDELEALGRDTGVLGLGKGAQGVLVAPSAMAAWMRARMDRSDRRVSDGLDAVTFCSLMPVRSVPYRWVFLLGVDQEIFPRVGTRPAWDLIAREPRPWDRNPRDEDRALFLDALLSAREACHIVYTGRTPQRNEVVAPAAPVAQLMEMLDRRFDAPEPTHGERPPASRWLTRHYPLQPFSERNFLLEDAERDGRQAPRPTVYHSGEKRAAESLLRGRGSTAPWALEVPWADEPSLPPEFAAQRPLAVTLKNLIDFHEDPLKVWLSDVAGLRWPKKDESAADDLLPVSSGVLDRLEVMKRASRHGLAWDDGMAAAFASLPIGGPGRLEGRSLLEKVARLRDALHGEHGLFREPVTRRLSVTLTVDNVPGAHEPVAVRLSGEVDVASWMPGARSGEVVLATQYSSVRAKHAIRPWLQLLLALAAEEAPSLNGMVIGVASHKDKEGISVHGVSLEALGCPGGAEATRRWAREHLTERLHTWLVGHSRPLPLLPNEGPTVVEKGYTAFVARGREASNGLPLAMWMQAFNSSRPVCAALPTPQDSGPLQHWKAALDALRATLDKPNAGLASKSVMSKMRTAARSTWNTDAYVDESQRAMKDTEKSILKRIFGEEGPAQRWPEAFVVDAWRVFGPGVALVDAMKADELTAKAPFAAWTPGGAA